MKMANLLMILSLAFRWLDASEFPERECCDPIYPPEPTNRLPTLPTPTGKSGWLKKKNKKIILIPSIFEPNIVRMRFYLIPDRKIWSMNRKLGINLFVIFLVFFFYFDQIFRLRHKRKRRLAYYSPEHFFWVMVNAGV